MFISQHSTTPILLHIGIWMDLQQTQVSSRLEHLLSSLTMTGLGCQQGQRNVQPVHLPQHPMGAVIRMCGKVILHSADNKWQ
jgi:hypothetical protein